MPFLESLRQSLLFILNAVSVVKNGLFYSGICSALKKFHIQSCNILTHNFSHLILIKYLYAYAIIATATKKMAAVFTLALEKDCQVPDNISRIESVICRDLRQDVSQER